eukprot:gene2078-2269_t
MRLKNRYILAQIIPGQPDRSLPSSSSWLNPRDFLSALRAKIEELYGSMGLGDFGNFLNLRFVESGHSLIFILRTNKESYRKVRFALSSLSKMKEQDVVIRCLRTRSCGRTAKQSCRELLTTFFDSSIGVGAGAGGTKEKILESLEAVDI